jgi:hypothetical protein
MANAWTPIASTTLASAQASVTFTVPSGYRDVVIVMTGNQTANTSVYVTFNGDTATSYSWSRMYGDGTNAASSANSSSAFAYPGDVGPGYSLITMVLNDYGQTDKHKTLLSRSNIPGGYVFATVSKWSNMAAVTTITIAGSSNFAAGFTLGIYGISG